MMSGEIVAIILERGRISDDQFLNTYSEDLIDATNDLSKDSQKYRAKRDRKAQRASFRDILRYIKVFHYSLYFNPIFYRTNSNIKGRCITGNPNTFWKRITFVELLVKDYTIREVVRCYWSRYHYTFEGK